MQINIIIKKSLIHNMEFNIIEKDVNTSCTWGWVKMARNKGKSFKWKRWQETQMEKMRRQKDKME